MKLQNKLFAFFIPLSLGTTAALGLMAPRSVHNALVLQLQTSARGAVDEQAETLSHSTEAGEAALLPHLQHLAQRTSARYAAVVGRDGVILAHTNIVEKGRVLSAPAQEVSASEEAGLLHVSVPLWRTDENFLVAAEEGGKTFVGAARLGLPLQPVLETEREILRGILTVVLGAAGVFLLGVLLTLRLIIVRLRAITAGAARIGSGEKGVQVVVPGADELAELAGSFNQMSAALEKTTFSKDYLDSILNNMQDAVIVVDSKGDISLINEAGLHLAGRPSSEVLGKPVKDLFQDGAPWLPMALPVSNVEAKMARADGRTVSVLFSSSPLRDGAGVIGVARDVTERKQLEMRMAQSEKLSAIGQLAAGVAHEINNPLGVILGFSQSVTRRLQAGDPLELPLKSIEREAMRCRDLVQNLLTFSRQGSGSDEVFDVSGAVARALSLVDTQARIRSSEVSRELTEESLMVLGNQNQVQQIVINLCTNGLDAMGKNGGLKVSCGKVGLNAVIRVKDSGSGIPDDIKARIFDPFFTTKDPGKGTGLGLSLVYELVEKHHGSIDFKTAAGEGTEFTVTLPLA